MSTDTHAQGLFFTLLGSILLAFVAGEFIIRLFLTLLTIALINYGLQLQGKPSLHVTVYSWFDRMRI
ncbi:hypothetical protein CVU75_00265 [Candidatus Dependentiae bacterium HGW-Dependentiae-1]|nr:MAG: hypothetical protein CVU75_00265 [Candidatus Dependentiae bacterium HGW-Dependentiae-1]